MENASQSKLLLAAAEAGDLEQVRELIEGGVAVDEVERWSLTALVGAAKEGHLDIVRFLVERGADFRTALHYSQTPLAYAAEGGNLDIVEYLVGCGAAVNDPDDAGETALMSAASHGHMDIVLYLISQGAQVEAADIKGWTPIRNAACSGHLEVVRYFVNSGADMNVIDSDGYTPTMIAVVHNHIDVARYLIKCGAIFEVNGQSDDDAPVISAAIRGHLDALQFLDDYGADLHVIDDEGRTPLIWAVKCGHLNVVKFLIDRGVDVDLDDRRRVPLKYAVKRRYMEIIMLLIDAGADVNRADYAKRTPLYYAASFGHEDIARYLIDHGAGIGTGDDKGRTPLMCAAACGHLDVVCLLIDRGAEMNMTDGSGFTPMVGAAFHGRLSIVQWLVSHGGCVDAIPAIFAASRGHLDVVLFLIDQGAVVNWRDPMSRYATKYAAMNGHLNTLRYMVKHGADVMAIDTDGQTLLIAAAAKGHFDVVQFLLGEINPSDAAELPVTTRAGTTSSGGALISRNLASCNVHMNTADNAGLTPLMHAARGGHVNTAQLLIDHGADVNVVDSEGGTSLIYAVEYGSFELAKQLISSGANVDVKKNDGKTALILAAADEHRKIVQLLFDHEADVNLADSDGLTPLMWAVKRGSLSVAQCLVSRGADPNMTNQDGESAIFFAAKHNHQDIRRFLLQHIGRSRSDQFGSGEASSSPHFSLSAWFISPFEVELLEYVETGNVGGEFRAMWLDTDVAVKLFTPDASNSTFLEEVSLWHKLRHPNIIKLYGACNIGHNFFVCEYASNGTVTDYLRSCKSEDRKPWKFAHQAALGLAYLHERGMIHGNLRGSNILVGSDGMAKLAGFEWSGSTRYAESNANPALVGSTRWQALERVRGGVATFASDVYSLGLCIIEVVTGEIPWKGSDDKLINMLDKPLWYPASDDQELGEPSYLSWTLRKLVRFTCSHDPSSRVAASQVARMLEQLKIQEESSDHVHQPEPEPQCDLNAFKDGETLLLWRTIECLMQVSAVIALQQLVFQDLEALTKNLKQTCQGQRVLQQYHNLLADFHDAIQASSLTPRILCLSSTRATGDSMIAYQHRIQDLWTMLGDSKDAAYNLKSQAPEQQTAHLELFVSEVSKTYLVLSELESDDDRQAFLTLLKSEIETHTSSYSPGQLEIMQQAYDDISQATGAGVDTSTPEWFVPWYELSNWKWLGEGGFGSVFLAKWLDSEVVVKQMKKTDGKSTIMWSMLSSLTSTAQQSTSHATVETSLTREKREEARRMFQREVDIWFRLSHPHIVRLFGACHVGTPFFVCEYAANGSLDKYLQQHPGLIWQKLREAALGVQYLHERDIVHGDLKCNNIVVGNDLKAKVTDFGLSSGASESEDGSTHKTGAWHWVAPECLADEAAKPTFASDVFALGMCIVEALRVAESALESKPSHDASVPGAAFPWLMTENSVVKYLVTQGKLPPRPRTCTDGQWALVEKMCRFEASDRIKICTVVDELSELAKNGLDEGDPTNQNTRHDLIKPSEVVLSVISEMHALVSGREQDHTTATDSRRVLHRVHKLLWDRLSHLTGLLGEDLVRSRVFQLLVESAKSSLVDMNECSDTLAEFTELALHGYALHRRLDKFLAANFVNATNDDGGDGVHAWQSKCYAFLGVNVDEEDASISGLDFTSHPLRTQHPPEQTSREWQSQDPNRPRSDLKSQGAP